jgi:lysophospholipase L1-like esterase
VLKPIMRGLVAALLPVVLVLLGAEGLLRLKNRSMDNYDIEMWRYSQDLKQQSSDPLLGHEHRANGQAILQKVEIRTNSLGLRGPELRTDPPARRILFLGSSITLGWGVPEDQTLSSTVARKFKEQGQDVEVLNAGIGNYNAPRYVHLFLTRLSAVKPTDIVVDYFVRDAEELPSGGGNILLRHSQLAVVVWSRLAGLMTHASAEGHYGKVYAADSPGLAASNRALKELADYAQAHGIRLYLAMIPEMHDLPNYKLGYVHEIIHGVADQYGYRFVDLYPSVKDLSAERIWALPGDPHPNALGHQRMGEALFPVLAARP